MNYAASFDVCLVAAPSTNRGVTHANALSRRKAGDICRRFGVAGAGQGAQLFIHWRPASSAGCEARPSQRVSHYEHDGRGWVRRSGAAILELDDTKMGPNVTGEGGVDPQTAETVACSVCVASLLVSSCSACAAGPATRTSTARAERAKT